jgi:hypothetical protein
MNDPDERIHRYLRSRADVPVPADLRWPSTTRDARRLTRYWFAVRSVGLVAVILVAAVIIRAVVDDGPSPAGPRLTGLTANASSSPNSPIGAEFPLTVGDMPVVSVGQAVDLLQRGSLDGRAVAVAGYFFQVAMSCPAPMRYYGSLERWCGFTTFTDDVASARLCVYGDNSTFCRPPSGTDLEPVFVAETGGALAFASAREPVPLVLIGHAGDARQWQCPAEQQRACGRAFVVDRVAWAAGNDVPLSAPKPWDQTTQKALVPRLTVDQAIAALDHSDDVLAAAAFRAGDISSVDPRWNLVGDDIVWIVRSINGGASSTEATRSVAVSLIDDATGKLLDAHDLALDPSYRPARLWVIATTAGVECCTGDVYPYYGVRTGDGAALHDGTVQGGAYGRGNVTTYGPGAPLVLNEGTYSVTAWQATIDRGVIGSAVDKCSTEISLGQLDDLMLEARFPAIGQSCTFGPPSAPKLSY